MPDTRTPPTVALLRGAAVLFVLLCLGMIAWLVDKAVRYPEIHASQLGHTAPLWVPMIVFMTLGAAAVAFLFLRAARRESERVGPQEGR